jgi:hypothetical protein
MIIHYKRLVDCWLLGPEIDPPNWEHAQVRCTDKQRQDETS